MKFLYPLILSLSILIFFQPYLTGSNLFFATDESSSDLLDFNYPQRVYLAESLKQNKIPLWTPYQQNGFPFLAEAQTGVFYPVNFLLFKFLNTPLAFNWSIITSFFILSFGTYFFLKNLKLDPLPSLYGALVITFSGFFISHLKHIPLLQAAVFFPWSLLAIDKLLEKKNIFYFALLSLTFSLTILPGHLPTSYSVLFFSALYFLFKLKGESLKPIILFLASVLFSLLLCAVQLLPTAEMIPYSTRTTPFPLQSGSGNIPLDQLLMFVNPFIFGNPSSGSYTTGRLNFWEVNGYIGLIPLLLTVYAFIKIKKINTFKILLIFSLLLVLGLPGQLFQLAWDLIPGLVFTRVPTRFLLFTDFFLVVISAFALNEILRQKTAEARTIVFGIILFTILDLTWYYYPYNGQMPSLLWEKTPASVSFLRKDKEYSRITNFGQGLSYPLLYNQAKGWNGDKNFFLAGRETLPAPLNSLFKIPSIHFQYEYFGAIALERRTYLSTISREEGLKEKYAPKLLGLQNVKYILSMIQPPPEATASFKLAFKKEYPGIPPLIILENPQFLPRAYIVQKSKILPKSKVLQFMASSDFDPKTEVVLEKNLASPKISAKKITSSVKLLEEKEDYLKYQIQTDSPGFFVLTDSYYPGWIAKVNNEKKEILAANYAFRAVPVMPGKSIIEFKYEPYSYYLGRAISIITLIILLITLILRKPLYNLQKFLFRS
jgi:hypothetical protein